MKLKRIRKMLDSELGLPSRYWTRLYVFVSAVFIALALIGGKFQ